MNSTGLPRASTMMWSLVLNPPRERAVDDHPFQVGVLECDEDPLPDPLGGPAIEPLPDRVRLAEPLREVTPGGPGLADPEHGIDEEAVVLGGHAGIARLAGE